MTVRKKTAKKQAPNKKEDAQVEALMFLLGVFEGLGVENFITFDAHIPGKGEFTFTLQRQAGITPAQKMAELRDRIRQLEEQCERYLTGA